MSHLSGVLAGSYPGWCGVVGLVLLPPRGWWSPCYQGRRFCSNIYRGGEIEKKLRGKKVTIVEQNQYGLVGLVGLKKEISGLNINVFKLTKQQLVTLVPIIASHCCAEERWVACLQ